MAMIDLRRAVAAAAGALLFGALLVGTSSAPAGAGPLPLLIEVTWATDETSENGETSLREAIGIANTTPGPSVIALEAGDLYQLSTCGTTDDEDANATGDLDHLSSQDLRIAGDGATIEQACPGQRVLEHNVTGGVFELEEVRITGGDLAPSGVGAGGGVRSSGALVLDRVEVVGNAAVGNGGGASATTTLDVDHSLIVDNTSESNGGGFHTPGDVDLLSSTVTGNVAAANGGGFVAGDQLLAFNSTVGRNRADSHGGGIWSGDGAGLQNMTVVANVVDGVGANIYLDDDELSGQANVMAYGSGASDCYAVDLVDGGFNVSSDGSCWSGPTSPTSVHPMLGPLRDNGGDTPTYRPVVGSPTLDVDALPCDLLLDQRDQPRPEVGGTACESGAVEADPPACTQAFPDVGTGHPFFDEICWLVQSGITTGFNDGTFKPANPVTRQSMSAFLYRLAYSPPVPAPPAPTFTDVGANHVFRTEVEWLAGEEITTGYQPGPTYQPGAAVTRQSMSAFLFRLAGEPAFPVPTTPSFDDVSGGHPFYEEIEWMAFAEVSTGYSDDTYRPSAAVSRAAMAAFLLRIAEQGFLGGI
jgi:hypothetical protein